MQKAKREDFRVEEELRIQKAKYEETSEEVYRRMQDVSSSFAAAMKHTYGVNKYTRLKRQRPTVSLI